MVMVSPLREWNMGDLVSLAKQPNGYRPDVKDGGGAGVQAETVRSGGWSPPAGCSGKLAVTRVPSPG
ncbi:MAG: hypothetical protein RLN77_02955, partial [Rhodospirillales bacterium]